MTDEFQPTQSRGPKDFGKAAPKGDPNMTEAKAISKALAEMHAEPAPAPDGQVG